MVKLTATRTPVTVEDLNKALAQRQAAAAEAAKQAAAAAGKRAELQAVLAGFATDDASAEAVAAIAAVKQEIATAKAAEASAVAVRTKADAAVSDATVSLAAVQASGSTCTYQAKVELLPAQGDPATRFVASNVHSPLRDDSSTLKVSQTGLLSSANVVAADRTADVIVELAGAIAGFGGNPVVGAFVGATPNCATMPKQFVGIVDPVELGGGSLVRLNASLLASGFPIRVTVDDAKVTAAQSAYRNDPITAAALASVRGGGLFYRSAVPVGVIIEQCDAPLQSNVCTSNWQPVDAALVSLPQAGPVSFIPMRSSAFVKTVNDVTFVDGSVSSWTADRPSEVLEIVRLPVRVLTALISVPAQILSLRVDYSSKQEAFAAYQRKEIERDARNVELLACIRRSEADGTAASACF